MSTENKNLENPRTLAEEITKILDSKKANGIKLLRIDDKTVLADYFVICGGNSNTQVRAIAGEVEEKLEEMGLTPHHIEGYNEAPADDPDQVADKMFPDYSTSYTVEAGVPIVIDVPLAE